MADLPLPEWPKRHPCGPEGPLETALRFCQTAFSICHCMQYLYVGDRNASFLHGLFEVVCNSVLGVDIVIA